MTLNDSRQCHQTVLEEVLTSLSNLSSLVLPTPCFLSHCKTSPATSSFLMQLLHEHGTLLKFPSSASFAWKINFHVPKGTGLIYMFIIQSCFSLLPRLVFFFRIQSSLDA